MNQRILIPIMELDAAWSLRGFSHQHYAKEYCTGVLKIPPKHIEESHISASGIEVKLQYAEETTQEEWYRQLMALLKVKNKGFVW